MSNLWDRPPIPNRGDANEDDTLIYVGRILSRWEAIEFELSRLHSCFAGKPDEQDPVAEYGKGTIFKNRADTLKKGADTYFMAKCDQKRESEFDHILEQVTGFSGRRNDIAHGILWQIDKLTFFRGRIRSNLLNRHHYAIIPPLYALRFHKGGLPDFCYSSAEMSRLLLRLENLHQRVDRLRRSVLAELPSSTPL